MRPGRASKRLRLGTSVPRVLLAVVGDDEDVGRYHAVQGFVSELFLLRITSDDNAPTVGRLSLRQLLEEVGLGDTPATGQGFGPAKARALAHSQGGLRLSR